MSEFDKFLNDALKNLEGNYHERFKHIPPMERNLQFIRWLYLTFVVRKTVMERSFKETLSKPGARNWIGNLHDILTEANIAGIKIAHDAADQVLKEETKK